jgi:hypothetical protein
MALPILDPSVSAVRGWTTTAETIRFATGIAGDAGGRYLGLAPDLTSANGEPPVELDWRAFCARYFPGRRRRYDLEAVVAYGAFRSSVDAQARLGP